MTEPNKSSTTTTTTTLSLKSSFSDPKFSTLAEMFGEDMTKKIYLRGRKLEEHDCQEDGSCRHLHDLFYANIFLRAQEAFEKAWAAKDNILDAAASPLFNGISYGLYQAPKSSHDGKGFVWYKDTRPVMDDDGHPVLDKDGKELLEEMWRLRRVSEGEDLGSDRTKFKKAQAHHAFESDCWLDMRGWRPNLYFFDHLYYLVPLTEEEKNHGHTKRIRIRAWDIIQGSDDLKLLSQGVEVYKRAKAKEKFLAEAEAKKAAKARADAKKAAAEQRLQDAKMLMAAEAKAKELIAERKAAARETLKSVDSQFNALCKRVDRLVRQLNKPGTDEREKFAEAVLEDAVSARTLDWVDSREFTFREFTFLNWDKEFAKTGNIFVALVGITTRYVPEDIWVALEVDTGEWVKEVIDTAQSTAGADNG